jgi:hypothetical protein
VSRAIAALEARIGVRLFQRTTRSMRLTEVTNVCSAANGRSVPEAEFTVGDGQ